MQILFVADPLESFQIYKDTTFAMMREAQARGHTVAACEPRELIWRSGGVVQALVRQIRLTGDLADWFFLESGAVRELRSFDAVVMRKDPPFDSEFFYATHLLEQAEREGAQVFNKPRALRDHPEKLAIMEFPQFIGPTLVTRDGSPASIPVREVVPGDIVTLSAGDMMPADLRLIATKDLYVGQSSLTGESLPVEKSAAVPALETPPLGGVAMRLLLPA